MTASMQYLIDSDVLITAKNLYYAFDICPGFWKGIIAQHRAGRVFSIDRVRSELLAGRETEDLVKWVHHQLPSGFFLQAETAEVAATYTEIMLWATRHHTYLDNAKAKFATGADGWLVAYARVHGLVIVTNEQSASESRKDIKLPDVCDQFKVLHKNTFEMLRELTVQFELVAVK